MWIGWIHPLASSVNHSLEVLRSFNVQNMFNKPLFKSFCFLHITQILRAFLTNVVCLVSWFYIWQYFASEILVYIFACRLSLLADIFSFDYISSWCHRCNNHIYVACMYYVWYEEALQCIDEKNEILMFKLPTL